MNFWLVFMFVDFHRRRCDVSSKQTNGIIEKNQQLSATTFAENFSKSDELISHKQRERINNYQFNKCRILIDIDDR